MQIQPIFLSDNNITNSERINVMTKNKNITIGTIKDSYTPAFTGFSDVLAKSVNKKLTRESEADELFKILFENLVKDTKYVVTENYNILADFYEKKGIYGIFKAILDNAPHINNIAESLANGQTIPVVSLNKTDVMILHNSNKFNLLSSIFNLKPKKQNPNITFTDRYNSISFTINRKNYMVVSQYQLGQLTTTEFYNTTGNVRKLVKNDGNFEETVYYHKNGSLNKLKTMFLGFAIPVRWY